MIRDFGGGLLNSLTFPQAALFIADLHCSWHFVLFATVLKCFGECDGALTNKAGSFFALFSWELIGSVTCEVS
jgi:hypothetical protein